MTDRKIKEILNEPKFKGKLVFLWSYRGYVCVRDVVNGKSKAVRVR